MSHEAEPSSRPRPIIGALKLQRSLQLLAEAKRYVPGVTHSMMKRPEHFAPGEFPVFLASGDGALVEDVDGQEYIDFIGGLGANLLGHNHPVVLQALRQSLERGILHSLPTPVEVTAAKTLCELVPGAEMLRFFKTGADATSSAVRLARHITGKDRIVTVGYNGWHDHFMFDTPGVPPAFASYTTRLPLFSERDEPALLQFIAEHASSLAVVLLSLPYNRPMTPEFMLELRDKCSKVGVLLVFDEVVTGFRLALGGAQEFYGVEADFVCFSKALAAGMPLSAIVGPRQHLERLGELQVSTTFGGELLSLAVCEAVLKEYRSGHHIGHIARLGGLLREGINGVAEHTRSSLRVGGYDAIPFFRFGSDPSEHAQKMQRFQAGMARRGVLLRRDVNFMCAAHTEEQIAYTIEKAHETLRELAL